MSKAEQRSKRKMSKAAVALGAAGVSVAMVGSASAVAPKTNVPSQDNARRIFLGEEEISDVSLATFHVFDKENESALSHVIRVAAGHGGCGGSGGHGGCGGCAHAGSADAPMPAGADVPIRAGANVPMRADAAALVTVAAVPVVAEGCIGGCGCSGFWIGVTCLGCASCVGTCWQWDPYLGRWISVCY